MQAGLLPSQQGSPGGGSKQEAVKDRPDIVKTRYNGLKRLYIIKISNSVTMFGLILRGMLVIGLAAALLVGAVSVMGRGFRTTITTLAVSPYRARISDTVAFQFVDLNRGLAVEFVPPVTSIRDASLVIGGQAALLLMRDLNRDESRYGLYYYDLQSRDVSTMILRAQEGMGHEYYFSSAMYVTFHPTRSPDGSMVAFIDPADSHLYIHHIATGRSDRIRRIETSQYISTFAFAWSPDSQQIAYRENGNGLTVVNVDGSRLRQFREGIPGEFWVDWSPDGRYILLSGINGWPRPFFRIIDAQTGALNPVTDGLSGLTPYWDCAGSWLSYIGVESQQYNGYTLNLETGRRYDVSAHSVFLGEDISSLSWMPGCEWLVLTGGSPFGVTGETPRSLYMVNRTGTEARLLADGGVLRYWMPDSTRIMFISTGAINGDHDLYQVDTQTGQPHLVGGYPAMRRWYVFLDDYRRALVWDDNKLYLFRADIGKRLLVSRPDEHVYSYALWEAE